MFLLALTAPKRVPSSESCPFSPAAAILPRPRPRPGPLIAPRGRPRFDWNMSKLEWNFEMTDFLLISAYWNCCAVGCLCFHACSYLRIFIYLIILSVRFCLHLWFMLPLYSYNSLRLSSFHAYLLAISLRDSLLGCQLISVFSAFLCSCPWL